ncbi:MAG: acetoacetyl-CoA synthetase [Candidatus Azotimanducaceae bacterium]|jgi:acetoacetyl-CoA synthetase
MITNNPTQPLWQPTPEQITSTNLTEFANKAGTPNDYNTLHRWSIEKKEEFWRAVWTHCGIVGDAGSERILIDSEKLPGAKFFPDARLNFAENLLKHRGDGLAIVSRFENGERHTLTRDALLAQVHTLSTKFRDFKLAPGDRVAAYMPNIGETVVTMLSATTLGCVFTSCSPDFGTNGVIDRFSQTTPRVLIATTGYQYNGKFISTLKTIEDICTQVPSIEHLILVTSLDSGSVEQKAIADNLHRKLNCGIHYYSEIIEKQSEGNIVFAQVSFNHPLYIMYSSGTTGTPKCIVHGTGGTLIQHLKEHQLHADVKPLDRLFYFTTCGWMMWNWLVSGLASGATLILYDGSPTYPNPEVMWDLIDEEQINIFGTSAKYLASIDKLGIKPSKTHTLDSLRTILSTGSPLSDKSFRYVYQDVKSDLCLSSISGGTDIISCFALGNPSLPVYAGELQCMGLGMDVDVFDDEQQSLQQEKGELVCKSPFPSMPIGFWNDEDGSKYHEAYFTRFPNIWAHGDFAEITANNGLIIHGRSDAILNPGGVRIGTAEIYRQVERIENVVDSICVGQNWQDDIRVILFVVLKPNLILDSDLIATIKKTIREETTPRHVPAEIIQVPDIPRTISGKIVELAVRQIIHGEQVKNTDALANPEALRHFVDRL